MIGALVRSSLKLRLFVVVAAAGVLALGVLQLRDTRVDLLPEFTPPYVEVQTEALGLSAAEVEQLITVPLEADLLNGVAWLDVIRSRSVPGLSSIELIFEPGTDIMRARQLVQERLTQAHALPNVSKPPTMLQPLSSTSRFMMVSLSSRQLSPIEMSVLARWTVRPRLMGVPGVANVAIWGQRERQLQVQVDPKRLHAAGVSLQQVVETTGNALWVSPLSFVEASTPGSGGFFDTPNQRLGVQHVSPIVTAADLARVRIEDSRSALRLGDVASVVEDHQPLIGDAVVAGGGILLVLEKFPGVNTVDVTRDVDAALAALRPAMSGVEVDSSVFRSATFVEMATANVGWALLIGGALVLVLLGLFLAWRAAAVSLIAIALSLVVAALVLHWRGAGVNTMAVAGLLAALGAIVDDAVVEVDNARRRLGRGGEDKETLLLQAVRATRGPLGYATLICLLVVLPVFFLTGPAGALARPLVLSYVVALLASLLVAVTVTPVLALILLRGDVAGRRGARLAESLERSHGSVLDRILRRAPVVAAGAVVAGLAGLAVVPELDQSLVPSLKERTLLLRWDGIPGASRPEMRRVMEAASAELRGVPGVRDVGGHVGRAVLSDAVNGIEGSQLWVTLEPDADYNATLRAVDDVSGGYPGLRRELSTYSAQRLASVITTEDKPITVRLYGPQLDTLGAKAEEIRRVLSEVDGVVNPTADSAEQEPQVEVKVNLAAAARYGLKPGDVRRAAATLLSGLEVGSLFEQQKVFDVVVRGVPQVGHSISSIQDLLLDRPDGGQVRLRDVADVRVAPTRTILQREAVSPRVDVTADVRGRDREDVAADVTRRLQSLALPLEYRAELVDSYGERQADRQRLVAVMVAALIGILLLLQAAFRSWRLAGLVLLALPLALTGGVLTLPFDEGRVTTGALAGLLLVLTIAVRQAVTLVACYGRLEDEEGEAFGTGLVLRGTRERLPAMIATVAATAAALVPFIVLGDVAGLEVLRPMAVTALGGLVTTTLLGLFVVPTLYLLAGRRRRPAPEAAQPSAVPSY